VEGLVDVGHRLYKQQKLQSESNVLYHLRSLALFQKANAELAALSPSDGRRQDAIVAADFSAFSTLSQLDRA
jgi:hypothetical protein